MKLTSAVETLFHAVADMQAERRAEYFNTHDISIDLRQQVESLLASDIATGSLLTNVVEEQLLNGLPVTEPLAAGQHYGSYRLINQIGSGGMGEVWLAERTDGLMKRQVAVKLPHSGLQATEFAYHSHRERDILAGLTHRGIARLYDAGVDQRERPFLVLEFIEGVTIDCYCAERQLGVRDRLFLFVQVLEAVQYAHSHLVIHSDLKPSNILVTAEGEVKLLDFGIARLIKGREPAGNDVTQPGFAALTPNYAAPEQLAGERVSIASDIYSLGIILYELLCGTRPYKVQRNAEGLLQPNLSGTIARPSEAAIDSAFAEACNSTSRKLSGLLKGDPDNVTLKAIQQNPDKRYATVEALRLDIDRYLTGQPVLARPDSSWYVFRKFVARHKVPAFAAMAVLIAIATGFTVALWQWHRAKQEAQTADAVERFILDIFEANTRDQANPMKARQTTARALVDIGARKVDESLANAPEAKERMLSVLSNLYFEFGMDDQSVVLAKKRLVAAKRAFGENDPRVAAALITLAEVMHSSSFVNEREGVLLEAKQILDKAGDRASQTRAQLDSAFAEHYQSSDRKKALEFGADAIALYRRMPLSNDLSMALYYEALTYEFNNQNAEAEPLLTEAVAVAEQVKAYPTLPLYAASLGEANESQVHYVAAETNLRLAWSVARRLNGDEHEDVIETESRLGRFLAVIGRFRESTEHLRHATDVCLKVKGADDPFFTPQMFFQYGEALALGGRLEEGLSYISRAIENRRKNRPGTRYLGQMLAAQALYLTALGQDSAARRSLDESNSIARKVGFKAGDDFVDAQLSMALNSMNVDQMRDIIGSSLDPIPANEVFSLSQLRNIWWRARLAILSGDDNKAAEPAARALHAILSSNEAAYLKLWEARLLLQQGNALRSGHNPQQALPLLTRAVQIETVTYFPSSPDLMAGQVALGECFLDLGNKEQAAKLLAQAESIRALHKKLGQQYERSLQQLRGRLRNEAPHSVSKIS